MESNGITRSRTTSLVILLDGSDVGNRRKISFSDTAEEHQRLAEPDGSGG